MFRSWKSLLPAVILAGVVLAGCGELPPEGANGEPVRVRLGYFPNVTHAQAMIGLSRGDFQKSLGPDVELESFAFNAGPRVIEAIYAGHLDMAYIGPSPALNGFINSKEEEIRVIAGSATNGVVVIGNKKRGITSMEQLVGKRIATPQYANTQDIAARYFLTQKFGAKLKNKGGETDLIPISNPDIQNLFRKDQLDAAWVPEPWGSRMVLEGLCVVVAEEKDFWPGGSFDITVIIARKDFVEKYPELVARFLEAHVGITRELQADPQSFVEGINAELERITTKRLPDEVVSESLKRTGFDYGLSQESFEQSFIMGQKAGIIRAESTNVDTLIVEGPLQKALANIQGEHEQNTEPGTDQ